MAGPKAKHYFGKKAPSKVSPEEKQKNIQDKQMIEQLKKSIAGKLKDPAMAKKAAQILGQMLEQKPKKTKKSS